MVEAARRRVLSPDGFSHVTGLAIDIDPPGGADWLLRHGHRWSLCQPYEWEWWPFEYCPEWTGDGGCPPPAGAAP